MEPPEKDYAHQLSRATSRSPGSEMFCQEQKTHLKMDSMSALAYMNKLEGTISPQLNCLAKELWLWCMETHILLKAQHLAGVLNTVADDKS